MTPADDVLVLRRVQVAEGPTGLGDPDSGLVGAAVDVETTGFEPGRDLIIELAVRRFRYGPDGRMLRIGQLFEWREDPGLPLTPEISRLTGLCDADLSGRSIDAPVARKLLLDADLVIAHNARFDRPFLERRFEGIRDLLWGCSMTQVDWTGLGFDGRRLGCLLHQIGRFHTPHGAGADVDGLITVLMHELPDGRSVLAHVSQAADRDGWRVSAKGAPISTKDCLKRRGYAWDPDRKVWWREVDEVGRLEEEAWLEECVYGERERILGLRALWDRTDRFRRFA